MTPDDIAHDAATAPAPAQAPSELSAFDAAELLRQDYREPERLKPITEATLAIGAVSARIVVPPGHELPVLLVRGSDTKDDWLLFNLLIRPMLQPGDGDTRKWARGWLAHAERVYGFAKGWMEAGGKLGGVYGHSLGGTTVQIICPSLKIPGISFGSPAPLFDARQPIGAEWVRANHVLSDDWATKMPIFWPWPPWRFSFVGEVIRHEGSGVRSLAKRHAIERYKDAVASPCAMPDLPHPVRTID